MSSALPSPNEVLAFWFEETNPKQWWTRSNEFDALITVRFFALHQAAAACELFAWRDTPAGRLAEIIVLDQFSRNMFRDQARAFACDPLALALAQTAVAQRADHRHLLVAGADGQDHLAHLVAVAELAAQADKSLRRGG